MCDDGTSKQGKIEARGVDIEIWEEVSSEAAELGAIFPCRIKINGVEVLTPNSESIITLSNVSRKECLTATVAMLVRSLTVHPVVGDA